MRFRAKMDLQCPGMASLFTVLGAMSLTTTARVVHSMSHPEIFEFQDVIKIKNKTTIFL